MPETKHSPLPWRLHKKLRNHVVAANGRGIASTGGHFDNHRPIEEVEGENDSNAEFVVHAVNAHDAMLAALRRQVANVERWLETGVPAGPEESREIYEQMQAAIAKAEEPDHA